MKRANVTASLILIYGHSVFRFVPPSARMNSESSRVVPKSAKFEFHSGTYISIDWGNLVCVVVVDISAKRDVLALVLVEEREHAEFFRLGVILTNVSVAGVGRSHVA